MPIKSGDKTAKLLAQFSALSDVEQRFDGDRATYRVRCVRTASPNRAIAAVARSQFRR